MSDQQDNNPNRDLPEGWKWEVVPSFWRTAARMLAFFYGIAAVILALVVGQLLEGYRGPRFGDPEVFLPFGGAVSAAMSCIIFSVLAVGLPRYTRRIAPVNDASRKRRDVMRPKAY